MNKIAVIMTLPEGETPDAALLAERLGNTYQATDIQVYDPIPDTWPIGFVRTEPTFHWRP